jgi:small subunit ribosomal protein S18
MVDEIEITPPAASGGQNEQPRPSGQGERSGGSGDRRGGPGDRRGPGGRGRFQRRRFCQFCVDKVEHIDYKDVSLLRRFVSDTGQMDSRRRTGTCARHQRRLTIAIKRARYLALLPYTAEHIRLHG